MITAIRVAPRRAERCEHAQPSTPSTPAWPPRAPSATGIRAARLPRHPPGPEFAEFRRTLLTHDSTSCLVFPDQGVSASCRVPSASGLEWLDELAGEEQQGRAGRVVLLDRDRPAVEAGAPDTIAA